MKSVPISTEKYTDEEYLQGIKAGDRTLIKAFYKSFFPRIKHYVESNNGKKEDAEDLFQEATIVLFRKVSSGSMTLTSNLYTYLYAICKNQWRNRLKKASKESGSLLPDDILVDADIQLIEKTEKYHLFRSKFILLSEDCQKIMRLFFERKKMKEIAGVMQFSDAYAKKRKHYCKEELIKLIKSDSRYKELTNN